MPKFSEHERGRILSALKSEGGSLFSRQGLRKTSVEDIAKAAGIAKGSFYSFFESKEELLMEILNDEEIRIHSLIRERTSGGMTARNLYDTLYEVYVSFYDNSLSSILYRLNEFPLLFRKVSQKQLEENAARDIELSEYIAGRLPGPKRDPRILSGLFRSIFLSSLYKDVIGEDVFDEVLRLQIRYAVDGLFRQTKL